MDKKQQQQLQDDILNKRIVDYGSYRIIYNIATGEISIYENSRCVMKKRDIKEVMDFFENYERNKKKLYHKHQKSSDTVEHCRERSITQN